MFMYDKKLEDLGIQSSVDSATKAKACFRISDICCFRQSCMEGEIDKNKCMLYLKSGENFLIDIGFEEASVIIKKSMRLLKV